jgi:hypothetical protein
MNSVQVQIKTVQSHGEVLVSVLNYFSDEPRASEGHIPDEWVIGGTIAEVVTKSPEFHVLRILAEAVRQTVEHEDHNSDDPSPPDTWKHPEGVGIHQRIQEAERGLKTAAESLCGAWDDLDSLRIRG